MYTFVISTSYLVAVQALPWQDPSYGENGCRMSPDQHQGRFVGDRVCQRLGFMVVSLGRGPDDYRCEWTCPPFVYALSEAEHLPACLKFPAKCCTAAVEIYIVLAVAFASAVLAHR
jgi:hypothetical protein